MSAVPGRRRVAGERARGRRAPAGTSPAGTSPGASPAGTSPATSPPAAPPEAAPLPAQRRRARLRFVRARASATPEADATPAPARSWWRRAWPPALAAAVVLALALLVTLVVLDRQAQSVEDARAAAVASARKDAALVLSYDHTKLDASFAAAEAVLTPKYRADYRKVADALRTTATNTEATVRAQVADSAVVDATSSRVHVLLFVNQTSTSNRSAQPNVDLVRVVFTMVERGGTWLVDGVEAL